MASGAVTSGAKIPKLIHQIWIGPNPKPHIWMKTFEDFCREYGYEYKLWTESNIDSLEWAKFPGLRELYDSFGDAYNGKSDVLRYLSLYTYGGIYMDADSVVTKPAKFAEFLETNAAPVFFAYEENPAVQTGLIDGDKLVAPGVIGAIAHHPFIELACKEMLEGAKQIKKNESFIWESAGPPFITRMYEKYRDKYAEIKIYPMKFFYPIHWRNITDPEMHKKIELPEESMLFQYGYSTNNFAQIFKDLEAKGVQQQQGGRLRRHHKRRSTQRSRRSRKSRRSHKSKAKKAL